MPIRALTFVLFALYLLALGVALGLLLVGPALAHPGHGASYHTHPSVIELALLVVLAVLFGLLKGRR